ncbi:hypothetical protein LCGC14_1524570 [marine sediment metagenome]|uniref:Uncharacterized protein n=1 Tax=marine sediment metagenome TaxID=412755 RepID=A0A0F9LYL2_9ZZZZ
MARPKITFLMQTRPIFDKNMEGGRFTGGKVQWGRWENWRRYQDNSTNLREAVEFVTQRLQDRHIGSNVYVRVLVNGRPTTKVTRLFQAKWGHDNKPFTRFDGIAGHWWRGQLGL